MACVWLGVAATKATGIQASGTRKRRRTGVEPMAPATASVMPPYRAAATLSGWPSRVAARLSSSSASGARRPAAAPSSSPATMAAALLPRPRAAGIMLLTSIRQAAAPRSAPSASRSPSRKPRSRRFCSGSSLGPGAPSPWALSRMPASSPGNSSARSFRLSAAAKQSKPLPRLALLAGTSTVAIGMGMRAEYREGQALDSSAWRKQLTRWSLTRPADCMKA